MRAPTLRFIDDCTGAARGRAPTADDWAAHLRAPVRFADALRALAGRGLRRARRARPRPALLAFARCTLGADCPPTLPSLRPGRPVFAESLAALWRLGAPVDWAACFGGRGLDAVSLPTYPFQRRRLWFEAGAAAEVADRERFALVWRLHPAAPARAVAGRWLVVGDGGGLGAALVDALRMAGAEAEAAANAPALRERVEAGAGRASSTSARSRRPPSTLTPTLKRRCAPPARLAATACSRSSTRSAAAGDAAGARQPPRGRDGAAPPDPLQGLRAGLARVVIQERPGTRAIDVDAGPPPAVAAALVAALADDAPGALRGDAAFVPRIGRCAPIRSRRRPSAGHDPRHRRPRRARARGRRAPHRPRRPRRDADGPPGPGGRRARADRGLARGRRDGAGRRGRRGGRGRRRADRRRARRRGRAGHRVIHAAGVLDDALLPDLRPERFDRVLAPKLLGVWHLHRAAAEARAFVVFSSVVGLTGNPGQGNYAAANAALDAFAAWRAARGRPTLTLRFGPWHERGMTAGLDLRRAKRSGIEPLPAARALAAFERALADREPAPVILALGDPPPNLPLFEALAPTAPAPAKARATPRGGLRAALDAAPAEQRAG
ncbi:MAG: KR domain-containing protein [Myxococcales bacterium]|nr:KR domain-containing protein [Myxococcales bacterium]